MSSNRPPSNDSATLSGFWFKPDSAQRAAARLEVHESYYKLITEDGQQITGKLDGLNISERLGNVERRLTLPDRSVFTTSNNDAVDQLFASDNFFFKLVHVFESRLSIVLIALVLTVGFTYAGARWGIPWASEAAAHALPEEANRVIAYETLEFLDKNWFKESEISEETQENIKARFFSELVPLEKNNTDIKFSLHFRRMEVFDFSLPNAFALPSGDIVITDGLIEISSLDDEIDSVLLHEMGHVYERHSMQMVIQSTIIATAVMLLAGDMGSAADFGVGIGSALLSTGYSRNHESEADIYAFEKMLAARKDPIHFANILQKMETSFAGLSDHIDEQRRERSKDKPSIDPTENEDNSADPEEPSAGNIEPSAGNTEPSTDEQQRTATQQRTAEQRESEPSAENDYSDYFSTHPSSSDRIAIAKHYSNCFKNGQQDCPPPH